MEQSTDPALLTRQLASVEKRLRELQVSRHVHYQPRVKRDQLKQKLSDKERHKDQLHRDEKELKARFAKVQVAHAAAKLYNKLSGPYTQESIGDVVVNALRQYKRGVSVDQGETTSESIK